MFEDELRELYKDARKIALEEFGKVAVGDVQKQFIIELKDRMKQKFKTFRQENEKLSEVSTLFNTKISMMNYQWLLRSL